LSEEVEKVITSIQPEKITKPIQLLGAWLLGLVLTNSSFLSAASYIGTGIWTHHMLVIASVVNVPLFLIAIFVLQTKFRPELQEDSYYSSYILTKTGEKIKVTKVEKEKAERIVENKIEIVNEIQSFDFIKYAVAANNHHPKFLDIKKTLNKNAIPISDVFGKRTQSAAPETWVITINKKIEKASLVAFLTIMLKFSEDFEGFVLSNKDYEEDEEDIYIGSYVTTGTILPLSESMIARISELLDKRQA
jgi:hypothetical protein